MQPSLFKKLQPSPVLVVAIAACVVALSSVAYATIPDSNGVIHGCYLNGIGTLRVIDTGKGQTCSKFETPITWSQTGPQGPAGPAGTVGPQGPSGPAASTAGEAAYWFVTDTSENVTKCGGTVGSTAGCPQVLEASGGNSQPLLFQFPTAVSTCDVEITLQGASSTAATFGFGNPDLLDVYMPNSSGDVGPGSDTPIDVTLFCTAT